MLDRPHQPDAVDKPGATPERDPGYATPRWVKWFGLAAFVVVLLVVVLHLGGVGGMPGPGLHAVPTEHGAQRP